MLEAIVEADNTNIINNHRIIIALANLFLISSIFLNSGTEHKIAVINIITCVVY